MALERASFSGQGVRVQRSKNLRGAGNPILSSGAYTLAIVAVKWANIR